MLSSKHIRLPPAYRVRRFLLAMPLIFMPLLLGGARPWYSSFVAAVFFTGLTVLVWLDRSSNERQSTASFRLWPILTGGILAYPFLQTIPLPQSFLPVLNSHRAVWLQGAESVIGHPIASAAVSYIPLSTVIQGIFWIFLAAYALVFSRALREEGRLGWLWNLLFVIAAFEALYGLLQVLIPDMGVFLAGLNSDAYRGMARGTFVNKNHYAAFLGMIWPLLLARILALRKGSHGDLSNGSRSFTEREKHQQLRHKQIFLSFIVGLVLLSVIFSQSRGGTLSALVALTVLAVLLKNRRKGLIVLVMGMWGLILLYGSLIGFEEVFSRFDRSDKDAVGRFKLWQDTVDVIRDHPWAGIGLGSFRMVIPMYQEHLALPDNLQASHAHNDYAELAAELGIPAAGLLFLLVWGYWWKTAWDLARRKTGEPANPYADSHAEKDSTRREGGGAKETSPPAADRRLYAVGALAGSASFLCHCWLDFNWQIPANQVCFIMLLVLMNSYKSLDGGKQRKPSITLARVGARPFWRLPT